MAGHQAGGFQGIVEVLQDHPRFGFGGQGLGIYAQQAVEAAGVQDDAAAQGDDAAHHAGAAAVGDDGDAAGLRQADNGGNLGGIGRADDDIGQAVKGGGGVIGAVGGEGVAGVAVAGVGIGEDVGGADDGGQPGNGGRPVHRVVVKGTGLGHGRELSGRGYGVRRRYPGAATGYPGGCPPG